MTRHRLARAIALLAASAVALAGCSRGGDETAATESPAPTVTTPELEPVRGERIPAVFGLSSATVLGFGAAREPDQAAIDAAIDQIADWLDEHLDRLQRTGQGLLPAMAAEGLVDSKTRGIVTTMLASPDAPVASARYVLSAYHDGLPQWLSAQVEVTHPDDSVAAATMVFVIAEDGTPTLTMFGPEPVQEVAS